MRTPPDLLCAISTEGWSGRRRLLWRCQDGSLISFFLASFLRRALDTGNSARVGGRRRVVRTEVDGCYLFVCDSLLVFTCGRCMSRGGEQRLYSSLCDLQ
jgi:hypothetical protein